LLEPFPAPRYQDSVPDRPGDASRAPLPPRRTRHQQAAGTASWSRTPTTSSIARTRARARQTRRSRF